MKDILNYKGRIWRDGRFVSDTFSVQDKVIHSQQKGETIEAAYIIPGFADPHIHGGWGASFQTHEFAPLENHLLNSGIFFAIPTLQNNSFDQLTQIAARFREYQDNHPTSIFPFLRVEGPFISRVKKGFQREDYILMPEDSSILDLLSMREFHIFTFAPEMEGALGLVQKAIKAGKIPSIGHSYATYEEFLPFYRAGVRHMTHYPNAMSELHHRDIGLTGAGLLHDDLKLEVIADGIHTSFEFIQLLVQSKGPVFALASDMIPPALSSLNQFDGRTLNRAGKSISMDNGTLAGGATTVPEQAEKLFSLGIAPEDLVKLACTNTLEFYNQKTPSIAEGNEASFALLDEQFSVVASVWKGQNLAREHE